MRKQRQSDLLKDTQLASERVGIETQALLTTLFYGAFNRVTLYLTVQGEISWVMQGPSPHSSRTTGINTVTGTGVCLPFLSAFVTCQTERALFSGLAGGPGYGGCGLGPRPTSL